MSPPFPEKRRVITRIDAIDSQNVTVTTTTSPGNVPKSVAVNGIECVEQKIIIEIN
jgi:hypothetical protein